MLEGRQHANRTQSKGGVTTMQAAAHKADVVTWARGVLSGPDAKTLMLKPEPGASARRQVRGVIFGTCIVAAMDGMFHGTIQVEDHSGQTLYMAIVSSAWSPKDKGLPKVTKMRSGPWLRDLLHLYLLGLRGC